MANVTPHSMTITINASPGRVWDAITNPDKTQKYMYNCRIESTWNQGDELNWRDAASGKLMVVGNVVQIEHDRKLVYTTFDPNGKLEDKPENYAKVTYELSDKDGKTVLTVKQENYPEEHTIEDMEKGWNYALEGLKKTAEESQ